MENVADYNHRDGRTDMGTDQIWYKALFQCCILIRFFCACEFMFPWWSWHLHTFAPQIFSNFLHCSMHRVTTKWLQTFKVALKAFAQKILEVKKGMSYERVPSDLIDQFLHDSQLTLLSPLILTWTGVRNNEMCSEWNIKSVWKCYCEYPPSPTNL